MTVTPHNSSESAERFRLSLGRLWSYFTITGNTSDASSAATTCNPAFKIFIEEGSDSGSDSSFDSGATFSPSLDDDADPAIVGFLGMVGDALEVYCVQTQEVFANSDLTYGTAVLCGASSTGVTLSKNIAYTLSMAGVDIDADTHVQRFTQEVFYRKQ